MAAAGMHRSRTHRPPERSIGLHRQDYVAHGAARRMMRQVSALDARDTEHVTPEDHPEVVAAAIDELLPARQALLPEEHA